MLPSRPFKIGLVGDLKVPGSKANELIMNAFRELRVHEKMPKFLSARITDFTPDARLRWSLYGFVDLHPSRKSHHHPTELAVRTNILPLPKYH